MRFIYILIILSLCSCHPILIVEENSLDKRHIFEIKLPKDWEYIELESWDSFGGGIQGPEVKLIFDYSESGYANHLNRNLSDSILGIAWNQNISVDTINGYYRKIIWPTTIGEGITGIYLSDLESSTNFNLLGYDLSEKNQKLALKAYKSIRLFRRK